MNKLMDKEYLQGFDAESIKRIAHHEFGLALSRTIDGKRKKFTKPELIEMILVKQAEMSVQAIETTPEQIVPIHNELNNEETQVVATVEDAETVIEKLQLSDVIPFAVSKLKEVTSKQELTEFKSKLLASFDDKQKTRKHTLKAKWSLQYNRLLMLFKQAELRLQ